MLKNQREHIDFFKKNQEEVNNHDPIKKILAGFFAMQLLFFATNTFTLTSTLHRDSNVARETFNSYSQFQAAARKGDNQVMIAKYSEIKNSNTAMGDMLASGIMQTIVVSKDYKKDNKKDDKEDYSYKIDSDTKELISYIYKSNVNSGIKREQAKIDDFECFIADFSCHIAKPIIQAEMNKSLSKYSHTTYAYNYNIEHPKELKSWIKLINQGKEHGWVTDKSPGEKYVEKTMIKSKE